MMTFEYEGVRLHTAEPEKMVHFVDQLFFFLRLTRRKARPVTIRESKGIVQIDWRGRTPKPFQPGACNVLCISEGRWVDSFTVQGA